MNVLLLATLHLLLLLAILLGLIKIFGANIVAVILLFLARAVFVWLTGAVKTKKLLTSGRRPDGRFSIRGIKNILKRCIFQPGRIQFVLNLFEPGNVGEAFKRSSRIWLLKSTIDQFNLRFRPAVLTGL